MKGRKMEKIKTLLVNERYEIHFITSHSYVVYDNLHWTERTKDERQDIPQYVFKLADKLIEGGE